MSVEVSNAEPSLGNSSYHDPVCGAGDSAGTEKSERDVVIPAALVHSGSEVVGHALAAEDVETADDSASEAPSATTADTANATLSTVCTEHASSESMNAQTYRDHVYQEARALLERYGSGYVQKKLQEEIAKVKKRESDVASTRKRVSAVGQLIVGLSDRRLKLEAAKAKAELLCQTLQSSSKRRQELSRKLCQDMAQHRQNVKERVEAAVATTRGEMEQRRAALATLLSENEKLAGELSEKKLSYEKLCTAFEIGLQDRAAHFESLIKGCSEITREVEELEGKIFLTRREHMSVEQTRRSLQEQLAAHLKYFETLAETAIRPEDVKRVVQKQRENMEQRFSKLESDKREAAELRAKFDSETCELRGKLATLRKEMSALDRAKTTAERKCRVAQQEARKNNH